MAVNDILDRSGAAALVPTEYYNQIIKTLPEQCVAARLFRRVPMAAAQTRVPVLSALPYAKFVNGEVSSLSRSSGRKSVTNAAFEGIYLNVEEIAALVPVPDALIADSQFDIWGNVLPFIVSAVGRVLDGAVFFGNQIPASWNGGLSILDGCVAAGNTVRIGTNTTPETGLLAGDVAELIALPEEEGFIPDFAVSKITLKSLIRRTRTALGLEFPELQNDSWYGLPNAYALPGLWPVAWEDAGIGTVEDSPAITVTSTVGLVVGDEVVIPGFPDGTTVQSVNSPTGATLTEAATLTSGVTPVSGHSAGAGGGYSAIVGDSNLGILGTRQDITVRVNSSGIIQDDDGNIIYNLLQQDMSCLRIVFRCAFAVANPVTYLQPTAAQRYPFAALENAA